MKKIFLVGAGLVIFSLALFSPINVLAATLTFDAATTLSLPDGTTLTVANGGLAESIVINDNSTVTIGLAADSAITIQSSGYVMSVNVEGVGSSVCDSSALSHITLTSTTAQSVVLTVSSTTCSSVSGGSGNTGGGGGGGGALPQPPTNTSVIINSGATQTTTTTATLTLAATNATLMLISNNASFSDAGNWRNYATSLNWTLTSGIGTKTVYAKFRTSSGVESTAVNDAISLVELTALATGNVSATAESSVALSDNTAKVTFPAGAISANGTATINPTTNYTAPTGNNKVVGNKAYDITVKSGENAVSTLSKSATLTFTYTDNEMVGINESTLAVKYWSESEKKWVSLGGTIDKEKNTITVQTTHFTVFAVIGEAIANNGDLIKLACAANAGVNDPCKAVYYLGNNGKRYVFPNVKTYNSWYSDFSAVKIVSSTDLAKYTIGGNVTYRPGVKLVKIMTDPKVYAVGKNGTLQWITTGAIAEALYGASWATTSVEDVSDAFFVNYTVGSDITSAASYDKAVTTATSATINADKGL